MTPPPKMPGRRGPTTLRGYVFKSSGDTTNFVCLCLRGIATIEIEFIEVYNGTKSVNRSVCLFINLAGN